MFPGPRVLVLTAGDELVLPGCALQPGQIYASNDVMIAAAIRAAGAEPARAPVLKDEPDELRREIECRGHGVDLIVTVGGISAGAYEVVKSALGGRGVEFVNVAMRPGSPQGVGRYQGVPVVALPGNPVSAWSSFEVFVRPALLRAIRHPRPERRVVDVVLSAPLTSVAGHRHFVPGCYDESDGTAHPVASARGLTGLSTANCLFDVPEAVTAIPVGGSVEARLLY